MDQNKVKSRLCSVLKKKENYPREHWRMQMKTEKSFSQTESESQDTSSVRDQLIQSLKTSKDYRDSFVEEKVRSGISSQIRAIREKLEGMSQTEFGKMLGKSQSWVARLENPNEALPTLSSLLEVAHSLDIDLVVRFAPFSELVDWMSGRPHLIPGLSPEALEVESFNEEEKRGLLDLRHLDLFSLEPVEVKTTRIKDVNTVNLYNLNRSLGGQSEQINLNLEGSEATMVNPRIPKLRLVPKTARFVPAQSTETNMPKRVMAQ